MINHHPINVPTLRVEAIGSGGGAIAWLDAGRQPAHRPAQRAGRARARLLRAAAAPSRPTPTPTWCSASSPSGACSAAASRCRVELARQAIDTQIAKPLGLSVEEAAAAIYAVQNAQTGDLLRKTVVEAGHDPARLRALRLRRRGPRALRRATPPRSAPRRSSCRSGRWRRRSPRSGSRPRTSCWPPSSPTPRSSRSTRPARSATSPSWSSGCATGSTDRACGSRPSSCTARSTCATRCSSPRSPRRWRAARSTRPRSRPPRRRSSSATPSCSARTPASARPASRRSPSGSAGSACCPSAPSCPRCPPPTRRDPAAAQTGTRPVCLDARAGFVDTAIYDYGALRAGHVLTGPAIVEVPTTTVVVPARHAPARSTTSATSSPSGAHS